MRKFNVVFAIVLAAIFTLTSCQKEQTNAIANETDQTELQSAISDDPIELADTEAAVVSEKGTAIGQKSTSERQSLTKTNTISTDRGEANVASRSSFTIGCGDTKYGNSGFYGTSLYSNSTYASCYGGTSSFSAPDVEYKLTIHQESRVDITLDWLDDDIDLFLFTDTGWGLGHCLDASLNGGTSSDKITIDLLPGDYWVIIDGYTNGKISDFRLRANCIAANACLFDKGFENFSAGSNINSVDPFDWDKYVSGAALDAVVSNNRAYSGSKSLKLDWNNAYAEDNQPRVLAELGTKSSGKYSINFKMYVNHNSNAKIALNKYDNPGSTAIEFFFRKGKGLACRTRDEIIYLPGSYQQSRWLDVSFYIDLDNRRGELYVAGDLVYIWNTATYAYSSSSLNNRIGGLQFHAYHNDSKFYVDDICFDELNGVPFVVGGN